MGLSEPLYTSRYGSRVVLVARGRQAVCKVLVSMNIRQVEGYQEGNVTFIFPEGHVSRFDLQDEHGNVRVRRLVFGTDMLELKYEKIPEILVMSGLIEDKNYVTIMTVEGHFRVINSDIDQLAYILHRVV